MERVCCPILTFEREAADGETDLWLTLRGAIGAKAFLEAEFTIRQSNK